jgi:hypothetical protein
MAVSGDGGGGGGGVGRWRCQARALAVLEAPANAGQAAKFGSSSISGLDFSLH